MKYYLKKVLIILLNYIKDVEFKNFNNPYNENQKHSLILEHIFMM